MKKLFQSLLFIMLLALPCAGEGATKYVTQNGTGDGSSYANAMSWATFLTSATGGNTYYLSGAFSVTSTGSLSGNGSAGNYIIIDGNDGINPSATITMSTTVNNSPLYILNKSYIEIRDISWAGTTADVGDAPIKVYGSDHILIHDNSINGSFHRGIFFQETSDSEIYDNFLTSTRTASQPDGIKLRDGCHDINVYGNVIYDWAHSAFECWSASATSKNYNIYFYSNETYLSSRGYGRAFDITSTGAIGNVHHVYIYNNYFHGMRARSHAGYSSQYVYVHDNVFYDTKNCCVHADDAGCTEAGTDNECTAILIGDGDYQNGQHLDIGGTAGVPSYIYVYNNTFYKSSEVAIMALNTSVYDNIHIIYNIIYDSARASSQSGDDPPGSESTRYDATAIGVHSLSNLTNSTIKHNVIYSPIRSPGDDLVAGAGYGYTVDEADAAYALFDDNIEDNPDIEDAAGGDFDLTLGSPAINRSSEIGYSEIDYDYKPRPLYGANADAGALEYEPQSDPPPSGDPTCSDVPTTSYVQKNANANVSKNSGSMYLGAIAGRAYTNICKIRLALTESGGDLSGETFNIAKVVLTGTDFNPATDLTVIATYLGTGSESDTVITVTDETPDVDIAAGDGIVIYNAGGLDGTNYATVHYHSTTNTGADLGVPTYWNTSGEKGGTYGTEIYAVIYEQTEASGDSTRPTIGESSLGIWDSSTQSCTVPASETYTEKGEILLCFKISEEIIAAAPGPYAPPTLSLATLDSGHAVTATWAGYYNDGTYGYLIFSVGLENNGLRETDLALSGTNALGLGLGGSVGSFSVSKANPAVVNKASHGLADGAFVFFSSCDQMTELNGKIYQVENTDTDSFELKGLDSSGYGSAENSGGTESYQATQTFVADESYNMLDPTLQSVDIGSIIIGIPYSSADTITAFPPFPVSNDIINIKSHITTGAFDWSSYDFSVYGPQLLLNGYTLTINDSGGVFGNGYIIKDGTINGDVSIGADCHVSNIFTPAGKTFAISGGNSIIESYTNRGTLDIDADVTLTNVAAAGLTLPLPDGVTATATYSMFMDTEEDIEALGGIVADKTGTFFDRSSFGFITETGCETGEASELIDKGITISGLDYDIFGNIRPKGEAWDIGCFEFGRSDFWTAGAPVGGCADCLDGIYSSGSHSISPGDIALMSYNGSLYKCILKNSGDEESVPSVIDPDNSSAGESWRWHCSNIE